MKLFIKQNRYYIALISGIALVNILLIFNNNVWCDEAFILNACRYNIKELLIYIAKYDMRPPLYLVCIKIWSLIFGIGVPQFKIFSIIPTILVLIVGIRFIECDLYGSKKYIATIYALLTGLSPIGLTKNIEITIYSWAFCFVTCSAIYAYKACKNTSKKNMVFFVLFSLLSSATHYFALVAVAYMYVFLFVFLIYKNKCYIKNCIYMILFTILGYLPILPFFLYQFGIAKKTFWITKVDIFTMLSSLRMPFEGENAFKFTNEFTMFFIILGASALVFCLQHIIESKSSKKALDSDIVFCLCICGILLLFLLTAYIISKVIRPLYVTRYFYNVTGLYWLLLSIMSERMLKSKSFFMIGLILTMFIFAYPQVYHREYATETKNSVAYLQSLVQPSDIFINNKEECASWVLNYYFPDNETFINCSEGIYYKDYIFDFSSLNRTAWYLCNGDFDLDENILESNHLTCEEYGTINLDNYYYFTLYKISANKQGD